MIFSFILQIEHYVIPIFTYAASQTLSQKTGFNKTGFADIFRIEASTSHCIFRNEKPAITSAPREVESIDTIIDQIKQKCSSNQALIQKVEKAISSDSDSVNHSDDPPLKKIDQEPDSKNSDSSIDSENYDELLDKLDEETDEDVIERVLKRYGLK